MPCLQSGRLITVQSPVTTHVVCNKYMMRHMVHDARYSHVQLRNQSSTDLHRCHVPTHLGRLACYELSGANAGPAHAAAVSDEGPMPVRNTLAELHCCMRRSGTYRARHRLVRCVCFTAAADRMRTLSFRRFGQMSCVHMARVLSMACVL